MTDLIDADEGIRLKVLGDFFACENELPKKRGSRVVFRPCRGQLFVRGPCDEPGRSIYFCLKCKTSWNLVTENVVERLPPRNDWQTPDPLWLELHREYAFNLDAAASAANTKCPNYFDGSTPEMDALVALWTILHGDIHVWARAFWNPPYIPKGTIEVWLHRALEMAKLGVFSVGLIPMSSSVSWFADLVIPYCEWQTFRGRIAFIDPFATADDERQSPKQDNLLVIIDPRSPIVGHTALRDARTGRRLWTRPDAAQRLQRLTPHIKPAYTVDDVVTTR